MYNGLHAVTHASTERRYHHERTKTKRIIQQDLSENDIDKKIIRTNTEYTF